MAASAAPGYTTLTAGSFSREAGVNHLLFHVLNGLSPLWGFGIEYKTKTPGQGGKPFHNPLLLPVSRILKISLIKQHICSEQEDLIPVGAVVISEYTSVL